MLINGAERRDFAGVACLPLFDMFQGWGHLNLTNILNPTEPRRMAWCDVWGAKAREYSWDVTVQSPKEALKVNLVWTDPPGTSPLGGIVNRLFLRVEGPTGAGSRRYMGNFQALVQDGSAYAVTTLDLANNVQGVLVRAPEPGVYRIIVTPGSLSTSSQDFAIVWSGDIAEAGPRKA
jgi:hypothetical protein